MESQQLLRIKRIVVEDLFGLYTHVIDLHMNDRITIIHGPNGVGKTVLLKMIEGVFNGKYLQLANTPFTLFQLAFDNGELLEVEAQGDVPGPTGSNGIETTRQLFFKLSRGGELLGEFPFSLSRNLVAELIPVIDRQIHWIHRIGPDEWLDERTGESLSAPEIVLTYSDRLPANVRERVIAEPDWFTLLKQRVRVYLVETQRLLRTKINPEFSTFPGQRLRHLSTVKQYAEDLTRTISDNLAAYGGQSQVLDRSFPQRLISGAIAAQDIVELKAQLSDIEKKRSDFANIGLIDEGTQFNVGELDKLDEAQRPTMTLFVSDNAQKLAILDNLAGRIKLFLDIVNKKFQNKHISINRQQGMLAETQGGRRFDLEALSSGEQHELVLTYDLLFNVVPNTFVMIDEPELSLHLFWQKSFLADLVGIVAKTQMDVLLATHSPYIAGDRTDLMVALTTDVAVSD